MEERYKSKIVVDLLLKRKNENNKEEILLVLRENTGYMDEYYDLPGGHVDHNFRNDMLKFVFSVNKYEGNLINNEPEKCKELKWFEIENLPQNIIPKIREEILKVENGAFYSYDEIK